MRGRDEMFMDLALARSGALGEIYFALRQVDEVDTVEESAVHAITNMIGDPK